MTNWTRPASEWLTLHMAYGLTYGTTS